MNNKLRLILFFALACVYIQTVSFASSDTKKFKSAFVDSDSLFLKTKTPLPCPITAVNITKTNVTNCSGSPCDGTATVAGVTGGTGSYTYLWSDGQTTQTATNLCPGTMSVTVTDITGGCSFTYTFQVLKGKQTGNDSLYFFLWYQTTHTDGVNFWICEGECLNLWVGDKNNSGPSGVGVINYSTGGGPYTFNWSSNVPNATNGPGPFSACPTTPTTYTITVTDAACISVSVSVTPLVKPAPILLTAGAVDVTCAGMCDGSVTVNASGASSPYTYLWNNGETTPTASALCAGTYSVTVTDSYQCQSTINGTVNGGVAITATTTDNDVSCYGAVDGSATVNASGGASPLSYSWSTTPVQTSITASNLAAGSYTCTITDANSCTATISVTITQPPALTLSVAGIDATCKGACDGQTIVIPNGGTSPYTYAWNTGCTSASCNNVCAGNYSITVTDGGGCTTSGNTTVNQPPALVPTLTGTTQAGCNGVCDGTATVSESGGTSPYNYSWNTIPVQTTATATGLCIGSYTCTVTDANSCTATIAATIGGPPPLTLAPVSPATICNGASATLTASASGGNGTSYNYAWSPAGTGTTSSVTVTPSATTTYTVTVTDASSCSASTSVTVTVLAPPTISVGNITICNGSGGTLSASGANTYVWASAATLSSSTGASVTANPTTTTTYTVTATSAAGCTGSSTVTVTVNPTPTVTAAPASICPGEDTTLTASGASSYSWSPASTLNVNSGSTVIAGPFSSTVYTITGTSANGCTASTTVIVTVNPKPIAAFTTTPNPASEFNPTVEFIDNSTGATNWDWNLGDPGNSSSSQQNFIFTYPDTGSYIVQLIVTNQFGCIDTTYNTVVVMGEFTFFIPNTFTPNGDGVNDGFAPKGIGVDETDYRLWIFDRWGNLIWKTEKWGDFWDGRANNGAEIAQIDTYVWKVHVRERRNGNIHNYIGHVNIVK